MNKTNVMPRRTFLKHSALTAAGMKNVIEYRISLGGIPVNRGRSPGHYIGMEDVGNFILEY